VYRYVYRYRYRYRYRYTSSSLSPFLVVSALPTGILHSSKPKSVAFYFLPFLLT
jgi:hypothetical protein